MLRLTNEQRLELQRCLTAPAFPRQVFLRVLIVLACAEGHSDHAVARDLKVNRKTVRLWRDRFMQKGLMALWDVAPGRGRKASLAPERILKDSITGRNRMPERPGRKCTLDVPSVGRT